MALMTVAVKVQFFFGSDYPAVFETYRLDSPEERAAWRANAAAYPSRIAETICREMTDDEALRWEETCREAHKKARAMKLNLRTSVPG